MNSSEARRKKRNAAAAEKAKAIPQQETAGDQKPATGSAVRTAVICVILAAATLLTYQGVRHNEFLSYDDTDYVLQNRQVQHGLTKQSIAWAFTTTHASNWHPLTWISHMIDWQLYGSNPAGHHMTSVLLHTANAVLLFLLLLYMTGFMWRSAMVAFLFALHPLHAESVAWIAERKDVLCAFFWFLTTIAYVWYARRTSWKRFGWVIVGFAGALLSKPMAVTLPFTLLLLDYWPLRRKGLYGRITLQNGTLRQWASVWGRLCIEKWPFFAMTVVSSIVTFFAQKAGGAVSQLQVLPLWTRLCNSAMSYWRYILKMFWPDPLMTYYHHESRHIVIPLAIMLILLLALLTAGLWFIRKKRPYAITGWLWYLGTLVPVIGIVQVGVQAMAERYTYLPLIGLFIAIVWCTADSAGRLPKIKPVIQIVAVIAIAAMAVRTHAQVVTVWKNTVTLFSHVLQNDPRGEFPNLSLGAAYMRQGKLAEAQQYFERALSYNPLGPQTLSYYAFCLMQTRNLVAAGQSLERAKRVAPNNRDVIANMAEWCLLSGRPAEAEEYCRKVIAASPDFITARFYLADALQAQNRLTEAAQEYREILAIEPDNTDAINNLGILYGKQGMSDEAIQQFKRSLAVKPGQALAHSNIGRVLMEKNRVAEAVQEFTEALRFDSANAVAHNNLGVALFQQADYEGAVRHFAQAVRLDTAYADAGRNLALAQARINAGKTK